MKLKYFWKALVFLGIALNYIACKETQPILFKDAVVVFDGLSINQQTNVTESKNSSNEENNSVSFKVSRGNVDISQALTINYTATAKFISSGNAATGAFTISGTPGKIVIPANASSATISISTVNNEVVDGDKLVTVTLTGTESGVPVGYPGSNSQSKTVTVTISDDDCALNLDGFVGDYSVSDVSEFVFNPRTYNSVVKKGSAPNTIEVTNFYNPLSGWADAVSVPVIIQLDPVSLTATVPAQVAYNRANGPRSVDTADLEPGAILTCTSSFTVNVYVYNPAFGTPLGDDNYFDIVTLNFTKK
jgi:hypothetical protein